MEKDNGRLTGRVKIGYGLGQFGEGVAYNFFYYFYTYFLVSLVGLGPAVAGTLSGFAVIWDAVTDPIVGHFSDRCKNPKGKRRSFIGKAAVPLGIVVALICYRPPLEGTALILYLVIVNIIFWVLFTICDIPWIALGNEITDDFDEKSTLRSIATGFMFMGQLVASGLSLPLVSVFSKFVSTEIRSWQILGILLGILTALGFLASYFATEGLDEPEKACDEELGIRQSVRDSVKVRGFITLTAVAVTATCATGVFLSGEVFYLKICYGMGDAQIAVINIAISIGSFLFAHGIGWLTTRRDKKSVLACCFLSAAVGLVVMWRLPVNRFSLAGTLLAFYIGDVGFWTIIFSALGDVTEIESYRSEHDKTGILSAFLSFGIKIGTALGMWFLGVGLDIIGYSETAAVEPGRFQTIFYIPLSLLYFAAFLCLMAYPYSRREYEKEKRGLRQ